MTQVSATLDQSFTSSLLSRVEPGSYTLGDAGQLLKKAMTPIAVCCAVFIGAALAYVALTPPTYVASAQLLIEAQKQPVLLSQEQGVLDLTLDSSQVENQIELLRSERISSSVIDELRLIDDGEFRSQTYESDGDFRRRRWAIQTFAKQLTVRRVGQSYVIDVSFASRVPERAAEIVNAIAAAYVRDQVEAKALANRTGSAWLQQRITEMKGQMETAARAVAAFKSENDLIYNGTKVVHDEQIAEVSTQMIAARAKTSEAAARLARVREIAAQGVAGAAVTDALNNTIITRLQQRYQDDAIRVADFSSRFGPGHEAVRRARGEMRELEQAIREELNRIAGTYLSEFEIAKTREKAISDEFDRLAAGSDKRRNVMVTLSELESRSQSYKQVYEALLQKLTESEQKQTLPSTTARVLSPAVPPLRQSSPKIAITLLLAATLGILGGLAFEVIRRSLDRTLRTTQQIKALGVPCLGIVPRIPRQGRVTLKQGLTQLLTSSSSGFAKSLRDVRVSLDMVNPSRVSRCIGIVSLMPAAGKSTVALSLAMLCARGGSRTLLIDADYKTSSLTQTLAPHAAAGLTEALDKGGVAIVEEASGLHFLPLGSPLVGPDSSDLISSGKMRDLIEALRLRYDSIFLDLPAISSAVDARAVGRVIDGTILVAEWGRSRTEDVAEAIEYLGSSSGQVVGVVLNRSDMRSGLPGRLANA